jgi:hypothetical protein
VGLVAERDALLDHLNERFDAIDGRREELDSRPS